MGVKRIHLGFFKNRQITVLQLRKKRIVPTLKKSKFGHPSEHQLINSQHRHTAVHTQKKNTPSCGARPDMAKIRTTKLSTLVCIVNEGEWRDFPP